MKIRKFIIPASMISLACCMPSTTPATAAPTPTTSFASDSPSIVEVGGVAVDQQTMSQTIVRGGDRTPSFTVLVGNPQHIGHTVHITDLNSGPLCQAVVQADMLASCTADHPLDHGAADVEAVVWNADGTEFSYPNEPFAVKFAYANPTIQLDSFDKATNQAQVSGTAETSEVSVQNGTVWRRVPVDSTTRRWNATVEVIDATGPISATVSIDGVASVARTWLPGQQLSAPGVTATESADSATLRVTGESDASIIVVNEAGREVSGGHFVDGVARIVIPTPKHEAHFTVTQRRNTGPESLPTKVVVHEGISDALPIRPTIGSVNVTGSRAVVPVSADTGSTVTIRSLDGRALATRVVGTSGRAQMIVALPASRSTGPIALSAEQGNGGSSSPVTVFTVGSAAY